MNNYSNKETATSARDLTSLSLTVGKQIDFFTFCHIPIFLAILCFSTLLAYMTMKNGSLNKHHCLILIAVEAMLNMGRQFIQAIYSLVTIFVPSGRMPFGLCCGLVQNVSFFCGQSAAICMLMIACDRLGAILFPVWYFRWSQRKFAYFMIFVCLSLATHGTRTVDLFISVFNYTGEMGAICQTTTCNSNFVSSFYLNINLFFYAITIAAYLTFFIVYHWKIVKVSIKVKPQTHHHHNNQQQQQQQQQFSETTRLYSALVIMCLFYSFGLLINLLSLAIQLKWIFAQLTPDEYAILTKMYSLANSLINLSYTPLLFIFSSKYGQALKELDIFCCHGSQPQSMALQIMTINNNQASNRQLIQRIKDNQVAHVARVT